jgi:PAS domain S-box-containing protein
MPARNIRKWNESSSASSEPSTDNESMFQLLFEHSADAILLLDTEKTVFVDCNATALQMMRCKDKAQLLAVHPARLSAERQPDGRSSFEKTAEMIAVAVAKGSHRFEWLARRLDGEEFPVEVVLTPIRHGERPLLTAVCRDITTRKQAEAALSEQRLLLCSIADNIAEAIYRTGPEHDLVYVNSAYLRLFGYGSLEEVRGVPRERLYANPVDRLPLIEQLARTGRFAQEIQFVRQDGQRFWGLIQSVAIRDAKTGQVTYHVGSISDITERKRMEAELRQLNATLECRVAERTAELSSSEARLRTLVEHAPEAIVVFDANTGQFDTVNENAVRLLGLDREALIKLSPDAVSPPAQPDGRSSRAAARELIQLALDGETPVFEWTHRHASGRLIPCEVRLVRLPAEGRLLVRGSITDNTERKRKENIQQAIFQISEAVHTADDLGHLYEHIHSIIKGLMAAENFYIAIFDPRTELLSFDYFVDERDRRPAPMKLTAGLTGFVLRTGQTFLANDRNIVRAGRDGTAKVLLSGRSMVYAERGTPAAIWLGAPLIIQGKSIGVVALQHYSDARAYGEEEKQILTFVAGQIARAIERKRSEQALRRRTEKMQKHRDVLLELAQSDKSDFDLALQKICALAAATLEVARVSYWSLEASDPAIVCELLYLRDHQRVDPQSRGARLRGADCPAYFAALATHRPIVANRVLRHAATAGLAENYLKPLGIASMLDAPVWVGSEVVGVLCHEHCGPERDWTAEEIDFASALATMVSLAREESNRARSEHLLRQSEEKFRALFEGTSQPVVLHDENGILEANPSWFRHLGYARLEDVRGKHPAQLSAPIQPGGERADVLAQKRIAEALANGSARFEWVILRSDGTELPIEVFLTPIQLGERRVFQAVFNDITERKRAEEELLRSLAREKELGQLRSNFISMVSHEFRTPLGVILSSAEILEAYFDRLAPDERREQLQSIRKNTRRMAALMEEVLLLGVVEAGKLDFKVAPVDLQVFCRRLIDELRSATDNQCPFTFIARALPEEANADERLLRHIFTNLLGNAVKYSPPGSPVEFEIHRDRGDAVCRIRDRGIGIPEADLERLFHAFCRGRNVGGIPGSGLGLAIVKRCVELHRGKIKVESTVGLGTTITVRLPLFEQAPGGLLESGAGP